jgi:hypothetical protein
MSKEIFTPMSVSGGPQKTVPHLDMVGVATILFALRYLQAHYEESGYTESEHIKELKRHRETSPLSETEIGRLCELINTQTVLIP